MSIALKKDESTCFKAFKAEKMAFLCGLLSVATVAVAALYGPLIVNRNFSLKIILTVIFRWFEALKLVTK
jgi:hypothetical protein